MSNFDFPKNFCEIFCCFFDETEKQKYNYYFCNKYTYGNKINYIMFITDLKTIRQYIYIIDNDGQTH
jgi:hypothetical protein